MASVELLGDFRLGEHTTFGPWLRGVLGEFASATLSAPGAELSGPVDGTELHAWLSLGVRFGVEF